MITKASEILFRCSGLSHLIGKENITEKQLEELNRLLGLPSPTDKQQVSIKELTAKRDSKELSEGVVTHLVDVFVSAQYSRREEAYGKELDKGHEREEDSITLYSRVSKTFWKKNDKRLSNEYITGEPDTFLGESIEKADEVVDTKTSWSANTFFRAKYKELEKDYYYQGLGYMALTGAKKCKIVYCLVNGTAQAIMDEKKKVLWQLSCSEHDEEYKAQCRQIEINHIFDITHFANENPGFDFDNDLETWAYDIPMEKRVHVFEIARDEQEIQNLYKRITDCREWIDTNLINA